MNALIVDPMNTVEAVLSPVLTARGWKVEHARHVHEIFDLIIKHPPDLIVVHGDGAGGEAAHICQRFKQNVLTAGIPIILVEDSPPPAWMIAGLPADAILQAPWESEEFFHHVEVLLPGQSVTSSLDDLTNFPRRASVIDEMHRRVMEITGGDPLPYGIAPNRGPLEELVSSAMEQGILSRAPAIEELFARNTRDLVG